MALDLGWLAEEVHESFWPGDPAFKGPDGASLIQDQAMLEWQTTGDGAALARCASPGKAPTRILFRALTMRERSHVEGEWWSEKNIGSRYERAYVLAFRIAVDFPDVPPMVRPIVRAGQPPGEAERRTGIDSGIPMLAVPFVEGIEARYPGLVAFFGQKVYDAAFPTEAEKKALLLRSISSRSAAPTEPGPTPEGSNPTPPAADVPAAP